ncbi:MAG: glycosyltransferase family 2 protein [Acidobacteriota bacterium]
MRSPADEPLLCALVVQWGARDRLGELIERWPQVAAGTPLIVVDNGPQVIRLQDDPDLRIPSWVEIIRPRQNLGFAGGVNRALGATRAKWLLLLNPDAVPEPGAMDALLQGFDRHPRAAGLIPRLEDASGASQHAWQLRPLPRAWHLLGQALFLPVPLGLRREPAETTPIGQPAAAALALRHDVLAKLGGLEESFYPAWFEDVDLCRRLAQHGERLLYWPRARFHHALGSSVESLGYRSFLWVYSRNLARYARRHHGWWAAAGVRCLFPLACLGRGMLLPLRRPRRARSRRMALGALGALTAGALSRWRLPTDLARRFALPRQTDGFRPPPGAP